MTKRVTDKTIERLRRHYPGMSDEEIRKTTEKVFYVVYDKATGEIVQRGHMDGLAFERHPVEASQEKLKIEPEHVWKLRGEFMQSDDEGPLFEVRAGQVKARGGRAAKVRALKLREDPDNE